ncbi:hypothetical protein MNB_SV-3-137 [hydrothermal vent metagenome]|uniref:Zinc-ribbon domain-containing protein n=1 Tax=hydrothermal vent metagenome TaxID=652676 RepID=A0A1W1BQF0_9ZZZZ
MSKMVKCIACKKKISINAKVCPNCGEPVNKDYYTNKEKKASKIVGLVMKTLLGIVGAIILLLAYVVYESQTPEGQVLQQKYKEQQIKQANELYKKVKKIPSSEIFRNRNEYSKLLKLDPSNNTYKEKYKYYSKKVEKIYNEIGKEPINVGMPYTIKRYIKRTLRDPDSLTDELCSNSILTKDGWEKTCEYRAKNGFGGYVKVRKTFLIRQNHVIKSW